MQIKKILFILFIFCSFSNSLLSQDSTSQSYNMYTNVDSIIILLYDRVTVEAGNTPDWDSVRSLFLEQAVIVLRTSRDETSIFSVEEFVNDFIQFIDRAHIGKTGFEEKIIRMKTMVMGDMAQALVLYEAHIPGSGRPPQQGVDNFSLVKKENRWWIVSITNEIPTSGNPIPTELMN